MPFAVSMPVRTITWSSRSASPSCLPASGLSFGGHGLIPRGDAYSLREIVIDLAAFRVTRNGRKIHLGPTEYRLLKFLMEHPNCTLSREEIIDEIWGAGAAVDPRTVDVYVRRLRDAITHEGEPDVIRTVRTAGYALNIE